MWNQFGVLLGMVALGASFIGSWRFLPHIRETRLRHAWMLRTAFIGLFILGYAAYGLLLHRTFEPSARDHLVALLLAGGGLFVGLSNLLNLHLLHRMNDDSRGLRQELEGFFQTSPLLMGIVEITPTDVIHMHSNSATQSFFGLSEAGLRNKASSELISPEALERWLEFYHKAQESDSAIQLDFKRESGDHERWFTATLKYIGQSSETGRPRFTYSILEITERRQNEKLLNRQKNELTQINNTLLESERRFRELVEFAPIGIFQTDENGQCIFTNKKWCEITGLSPEEARGSGWSQAIHPEDQEGLLKAWEGAFQRKAPLHSEARFQKPNGAVAWIISEAIPLRDHQGHVTGYLGSVQDISSLKSSEEERVFYQKAIEASAIVSFTDAQGTIRIVNDNFCRISQYSREELIGSQHRIVNSGTMPPEFFPNMWKEISSGKIWRGEICNRKKDGSLYWVDTVIVPFLGPDKKPSRYLSIRYDVTSRKRQERELDIALKKAEAATRAKSDFLAMMSHEIRTPMNGILGLARLLLESSLNPEQKSQVQLIFSSGDSLLLLINDILDYSKIESGRMILENHPFNLYSSIDESISFIGLKAREKGIQIGYQIDATVPKVLKGDVVRIRQILFNLLSNAIKFTEKGRVFLKVESRQIQESQHEIHLEVSDTGIGISPQEMKKLFRPFVQADGSTTRRFGGTGLGLAICKQLTDSMGGQISVESSPGEGSTFHVFLQMSAAPLSDLDRLDTSKDNDSFDSALGEYFREKCLVAEDNPVNQKVALGFLQKFGIHADLAQTGQEAVRYFSEKRPTLIFMDIHMPEMDGLEATAAIRKLCEENHWPQPSIVAMTAGVREEDRELCRNAGMNDYLGKPFTPEELKHLLQKLARNQLHPVAKESPDFRTTFDPTELADWEGNLLKRFAGSEEILAETASIFLNHLDQTLQEIRQALDEEDRHQLLLRIHTFKGALANFEWKKLTQLAGSIEKDLRGSRTLDALKNDILQLLRESESSSRQLTKWSTKAHAA